MHTSCNLRVVFDKVEVNYVQKKCYLMILIVMNLGVVVKMSQVPKKSTELMLLVVR